MEIVIEHQRQFSAELSRRSSADRKQVEAAIARIAKSASTEGAALAQYAFSTHRVRLPHQLESTLFVARVGGNWRLLFTVDDDPLFRRTIIKLLRLVRAHEVEVAFRQAAHALYQDFDYAIEETNGASRKATR